MKKITRDNINNDMFNIDADYEAQIRNFSDKLCGFLENEKRRQIVPKMIVRFIINEKGLKTLEIIRGSTCSTSRASAYEQLERNRTVGTAINAHRFQQKIFI